MQMTRGTGAIMGVADEGNKPIKVLFTKITRKVNSLSQIDLRVKICVTNIFGVNDAVFNHLCLILPCFSS